jgi:hypothetical protein
MKRKKLVYGQADHYRHYAVCLVGDEAWRACEVEGLVYHLCTFDTIPEDDWDRISQLEEKANAEDQR